MNRKILLTFVFWIATAGSLVLGATGGGDGPGNGGDPLSLEFVARGRYIVSRLRLLGPRLMAPLNKQNLDALEKALDTTTIELVTHTLVDKGHGGVVTSLVIDDPNHPGMKIIQLNRSFWTSDLIHGRKVNQYVLHEYLRVIGLGKQDDRYRISSQINDDGTTNQRHEIIEFQDFIAGAMVERRPFDEDDATAADNAAAGSYYTSYLSWMGSLTSQVAGYLGSSVSLLNVQIDGLSIEKSVIYDDECEAARGNRVGEYYHAAPLVRLSVQTPDAGDTVMELPNRPKIGVTTPRSFQAFPLFSASRILDTLTWARKDYETSCHDWLRDVKTTYGSAFVFAHCGDPEAERGPEASLEYGRNVQYFSWGRIYVIGKK